MADTYTALFNEMADKIDRDIVELGMTCIKVESNGEVRHVPIIEMLRKPDEQPIDELRSRP